MSRSPFAYPLVRNIDSDAGGAADLQTDIMRFMAILALCLMAIFALVQSIPLAPVSPPEPEIEPVEAVARPRPEPAPESEPAREIVALTRPQPKPVEAPLKVQPKTVAAAIESPPDPEPTPASQEEGFTLRFESDQALMRLVAASQVGLYAISQDRAHRMTVSSSRISFWDASTPNSFHEMETHTVPASVINALERSGAASGSVAWGVTLPGRLSTQLDGFMRDHTGGSLVIGADGNLRLEKS